MLIAKAGIDKSLDISSRYFTQRIISYTFKSWQNLWKLIKAYLATLLKLKFH